MSDNTSVKVAIRVRPLVEHERSKGAVNVVDIYNQENQIQIKNTDKAFTYNYVFGPETSQNDFYCRSVQQLIDNLFKGYNVTIFAYGQTGSGKTHSMGTAYGGEQDTGVIPRAINDIFNFVKDNFAYDFTITVSFMELYQEVLYDLLSERSRDNSTVDIREDIKGIIVPNLTEQPVKSAMETLDYLNKGSKSRSVASTNMNSQSSRSHAIFTINICMQKKGDSNLSKTAKFNLVDLAGSERSKKTGATGQTFKEGVNINKGLFVLGKVISALGEDKGEKHISYRESNLTRLLKDSLGGNSITLMIACISPADNNLDETLSTLRYADRARKIKNTPIVNQDPKAAEINRLKKLVDQLRLELAGQGGSTICQAEFELLKKENRETKDKQKEMVVKLSIILNEKLAVTERLFICQGNIENLIVKIDEIKELYNSVLASMVLSIKENDAANIEENLKRLHEVQEMIDKVGTELVKSDEDIKSHERNNTVLSNSSRFSVEPEVIEQHENHNIKQCDLNDQLNEVIKGLAMKEHLCKEMEQNAKDLINIKVEERMEERIALLEKEKTELMQKLKETKGTKASEHHSKRVQDLEVQIQDLKKKIVEVDRLKKMKDRNEQKIKQLNNEILLMKQTKVKLMKTIKQENDNFRNYKNQKERDLIRLEQKDRKQQSQILKMQTMHDRKENMLKRKVEEAAAANKRLKDALALRKNVAKSKVNSDKIEPWIKQELDIHLSIVDAQTALTNLLEDRASLTSQLDQIEDQDSTLTTKLQHQIDCQNTQISNLQQKLMDFAEEDKSKTRWDNIQTMGDAKLSLNTLFTIVGENHKAHYSFKQTLNDVQTVNEEQKNEIKHLNMKIQQIQLEKNENLVKMQKECEEKIAVLLRRKLDESSEDQTKQLDDIKKSRIDFLENELAEKEKLISELNASKNLPKIQIVSPKTPVFVKPSEKPKLINAFSEALPESPLLDEDDESKDPDWKKTPLFKRVLENRHRRTNIPVENKAVKRTSEGGCSCKGNCSLRYCGCNRFGKICDASCKCKEGICINREHDSSNSNPADIVEDSDNDNLPAKKAKVPLKPTDENEKDKPKRRLRKLFD